ncbi:DNAse I-like superfamily protein, partial [Striga hermonthica]
KRFMFDRRWLAKPGFKESVEKAWKKQQEGTPLYVVMQRIKETRVEFLKWSCKFRTETAKLISKLHNELSEMRSDGKLIDWKRWDDTKKKLNEAYKLEEQHWEQKARITWLKHGDKNSRYFHAQTVQRRKRNTIVRLNKEDGTLCDNKEKIDQCIEEFYHQLFTSEGTQNGESALQDMMPVINEEMNSELEAPVRKDEIKEALFNINPNKAP